MASVHRRGSGRLFRINSDINVAKGAECVRLAYEPVVVQRDAVSMAGIEFAAGQHQLQLFHDERKRLVKLAGLRIREFACDIGTVSEIMQPVAFLYQPCTEARGDITFQSPPRFRNMMICRQCFIQQGRAP